MRGVRVRWRISCLVLGLGQGKKRRNGQARAPTHSLSDMHFHRSMQHAQVGGQQVHSSSIYMGQIQYHLRSTTLLHVSPWACVRMGVMGCVLPEWVLCVTASPPSTPPL